MTFHPRPGVLLVLLAMLCAGCEKQDDHKVHVTYWEKWTGAEGEAMQEVVDAFNRSQDRIVVEYLNVSQVERKTMLAIAGGDPPDIAGIFMPNLASYVDNDALMPLDGFIAREKMTPAQWLERYYPIFADMGTYRGHVWALVSATSTTALHWNKAMFRAAGLDPERPPRTVAELDDYAAKLTKRDASGRVTQMGFLPQEPGWHSWAYPQWFGGRIIQGREITIGTDPRNLDAYRWTESYTRKLGLESVRSFTGGFGDFSSPQNPFFSGQVAMVFQGVWLANFIRQFSPGMEYGVAPWPVAKAGLENFTVADGDLLTIPRGAKHPKEAWQFIKYVSSINPAARRREELQGMELLCYLQEKNSPMRQWSPFFEQHHPHPYIGVFRKLSESPNAIHMPQIGIWDEYLREIGNVFDKTRLLLDTPENAIASCQKRVAGSWAWHLKSIERRYGKSVADDVAANAGKDTAAIPETHDTH